MCENNCDTEVSAIVFPFLLSRCCFSFSGRSMFMSRSHSNPLEQIAWSWSTKLCTHKNGQIYALSQSYLVCLNNALNMEKKCISGWPLCTGGRSELSSKEGRTGWKQDSKDENLQHIHSVQTSNVEKIIMEIPAKFYLRDLFFVLLDACYLNKWNSASRRTFFVFFKKKRS